MRVRCSMTQRLDSMEWSLPQFVAITRYDLGWSLPAAADRPLPISSSALAARADTPPNAPATTVATQVLPGAPVAVKAVATACEGGSRPTAAVPVAATVQIPATAAAVPAPAVAVTAVAPVAALGLGNRGHRVALLYSRAGLW